ncbi:serpentine type 7TM GPCR chemoreceptor srt domain-containing protein [Ditylenchus destructor]|uniref:Serpentine type 7TM GPCR chemoreceptor srt domain-containing protein n=1 Tax=Ditylenchus destructor TaxID=166010 RepID=A0AAD4MKV4_9BILA|nr:serpentine type 7TM GPCR chemoreceptor srt domain-containing protein [Ditylenchus destructor]
MKQYQPSGICVGYKHIAMSLNDYVFHQDEFVQKYNCSKYNVDSIPVEERRNVRVGILFVSLGALCEIVYLPCLWAIYKQIRLNRLATCYTFMLYLGVIDVINILDTAFLCGILSMKGIMFCQLSEVLLFSHNLGMFLWFAANTTTLILAINRCMVIYDDDLADRLFKDWRGVMWLLIPTTVGFVCMWLSTPVFYNPIDSSAIFNPHRHYLPDDEFFHSTSHLVFNWFIVITIPTVYIVFAVFFANKMGARGKLAVRENRNQKKEINTFLQVLVTSFFVLSTSLGFIYQQYLESFPVFVFSGYILYEGSPAFIYLCMNESIRNTLLRRSHRIYTTSNAAGSTSQRTPASGIEQNARPNDFQMNSFILK